MEKKIVLNCDFCNKQFERSQKEHKRNLKKSRKTYCSLRCNGKVNCYNIPIEYFGGNEKAFVLKGKGLYKKKDELSPFRYYLRKAKTRGKELNITLEYLKQIWDNQNGICPYSGINLIHHKEKGNDMFLSASLDRIDSKKGYIIGNVQFVSLCINYMKHELSHIETVNFCNIISKFWSNKK